MGRKAIARARKPLTQKAEVWVRQLVPLLQNRQLAHLTLDELAELMGKSKSTIYSYFSTKEEIYLTAVQLILDDLRSVLSDDLLEQQDMEYVLRLILTTISQGISGISIRFLEQIQLHFPEAWSVIEGFTSSLLDKLELIYEKGMEARAFKRFNVSILIALDRHFVMSIMTNADLFSKKGMDLQDLVNEYLELRMSALKIG